MSVRLHRCIAFVLILIFRGSDKWGSVDFWTIEFYAKCDLTKGPTRAFSIRYLTSILRIKIIYDCILSG